MPFDSHSQVCAEFRITRQRELEILFSKHQLIPRIKQEFIEAQAVELLTQIVRMRRLRPIDFARFRWVTRLREGHRLQMEVLHGGWWGWVYRAV